MKFGIFFFFILLIACINALNKEKDCRCRIGSQKRIINGRIVDKSSYPWLAAIHLVYDGSYVQSKYS